MQNQVEVVIVTRSPFDDSKVSELASTDTSLSSNGFQQNETEVSIEDDVDIPVDCRNLFLRILERVDKNNNSIKQVLDINKKLQEDLDVLNFKCISQCNGNLNMNLRFFEDLAPDNEYILKVSRDLKYLSIIKDFVVRNGFTKVCLYNTNIPIKIAHPDDLHDMFLKVFR